jgi:predicted ester cyclase
MAKGREGLKNHFSAVFNAFPDLRVEIQQLIAEGDSICACVEMTGTHRGSYAGLAATGRQARVSGFDWIRFENGVAVERWGVFDQVGLMNQLGAIPGPTAGDLKGQSRRYYELLDQQKGNLTQIRAELLHPQAVIHFAGQPHPLNADQLQTLATSFWAAFPDIKHELKGQVAEGNTVITRLSVSATHKNEFSGVKGTNKRCRVDAYSMHRYQDGKIVEQQINVDMLSLLQQIGAIPEQRA